MVLLPLIVVTGMRGSGTLSLAGLATTGHRVLGGDIFDSIDGGRGGNDVIGGGHGTGEPSGGKVT